MKNLQKLGKTLSKIEQKMINGGHNPCPIGGTILVGRSFESCQNFPDPGFWHDNACWACFE